MPRKHASHLESPVRTRDSPMTKRSLQGDRSPPPRYLPRHRSSRRESSPKEKRSGRSRSPVLEDHRVRSDGAKSYSRARSRSMSPVRAKRSHRHDDYTYGQRQDQEDVIKNSMLERNEESKHSRRRNERSVSPQLERHYKTGNRHHSPEFSTEVREHEVRSSRRYEQRNGEDSIAKMKAAEDALEAKTKQKPSFELSGKLAAETNRVRGIALLFVEPPDSQKPIVRWRLYVFKGGEVLNEPLYIHRQSCYLFGRERRVADIPTDHPSCSKQHAVIQFRQITKELSDGASSKSVRPYLMDLGSTNKTFINDNPIEPRRYYELFEKDTIRFGNSSREYVLLHENSAG